MMSGPNLLFVVVERLLSVRVGGHGGQCYVSWRSGSGWSE
jgi:hypothetical protein